MAAPANASVGHGGSFRHFAAQLYCAGAEAQACPNDEPAGKCYWYKRSTGLLSSLMGGFEPVNTQIDVNKSAFWEQISRRMPSDRWDPLRANAKGFRYYGREAAAKCLRGRRIHVAGDSTTRDTFYELLAVAGHPIFGGDRGRWPYGSYEPDSPLSSGGRDSRGQCLGDLSKRMYCIRDERHNESAAAANSGGGGSGGGSSSGGGIGGSAPPELRVSFQFLMRSNSSWERSQLVDVMSERPLDVALVQCPIYEWFKPDAYNYSKTKEERGRLAEADTMVGPRHFEGIGAACAEYVDTMVRPNLAPNGRIFVLGITPLPQWTRTIGTDMVESRIFDSIHKAFGLRCRRHADGSWAFSSHSGVGAIDRYAVVGPRRRDAIHPFFNAQFAIVQLVLNHLCTPHSPHDDAPRRRRRRRRR